MIRIPRPATAPVDSAAISVVRAVEIPRRIAVIINGVVAGKITLTKRSESFAPSTSACFDQCLIHVGNTLENCDVIVRNVASQVTMT